MPEPVPSPSFRNWVKARAAALRSSSDPEAFAAELRDELLRNDFMRDLLKDALARWIILSSGDPGSDQRLERLKRDGLLDPEAFDAFLSYVTARAERAEELFMASLSEKKIR
jgi:SOS response regulatory protein OraA/RecX